MLADRNIIGLAVERIVAAVRPERIILFGSHACGDAGVDADYDLLVVESEAFGPRRSRLAEIARLEESLGSLLVPFRYDAYDMEEEELDRMAILRRVESLVAKVRMVCATCPGED
jgi:predicted nucleotidyltransferase